MATFTTAVRIEAPPRRIVAVWCDVERWPEWTTTVTSAERLDKGSFALGSRVLLRQPKLPPLVWQVTAFEAERGFAWATCCPGAQLAAEHWAEPDDGGGRVAISLHFSGLLGSLVGRLFRSLPERYLATEAQGLRARCESRATAAG